MAVFHKLIHKQNENFGLEMSGYKNFLILVYMLHVGRYSHKLHDCIYTYKTRAH